MRRQRGFDPDLTREAIRGPGIDTRAWGSLARVDDDPDAVVWDAELGWLVDVTMIGGGLDGDGPVLARVASEGQGATVGTYRPPRPSGFVLVQLPTSDPNDVAVITGQLHTDDEVDGNGAPATVNGSTIVERDAADGQIAAIETHIDVYPDEDLDQEWRNARITANLLTLGAAEADQPYVRGDDFGDALDDFADAISDFAQALISATPAAPNAALTVADAIAAATPLLAAAEALKGARERYLSDRINGD